MYLLFHTVYNNCSVEIDAFSNPECNNVTSADTKATTAIVGGVLGGVFIMLIAAVALVILVVRLRSHLKSVSYNPQVYIE